MVRHEDHSGMRVVLVWRRMLAGGLAVSVAGSQRLVAPRAWPRFLVLPSVAEPAAVAELVRPPQARQDRAGAAWPDQAVWPSPGPPAAVVGPVPSAPVALVASPPVAELVAERGQFEYQTAASDHFLG